MFINSFMSQSNSPPPPLHFPQSLPSQLFYSPFCFCYKYYWCFTFTAGASGCKLGEVPQIRVHEKLQEEEDRTRKLSSARRLYLGDGQRSAKGRSLTLCILWDLLTFCNHHCYLYITKPYPPHPHMLIIVLRMSIRINNSKL